MLRIFLAISFIVTLATSAIAIDYVDPTTGIKFVFIKGGTFLMGDPTGKDKEASPAHEVTVGDFYMGQYEVTFAQYNQFCEETEREKPDDAGWGRENRPVINVDWNDAVAFTTWLSEKTGKVIRLPSEAEWEYAARGGTTTKYWWGDEWQEKMGNCDECGTKWDNLKSAPVGSFKANPYGLYDMTGNVYEWCLDYEHNDYIGAPMNATPWTEGGRPNKRVSRGGSWRFGSFELNSASRCWGKVTEKSSNYGFRVLMEP